MADSGWEQVKTSVVQYWWAVLIILVAIVVAVLGILWWKKVTSDSRASIVDVPPRLLREYCHNPRRGGVAVGADDSGFGIFERSHTPERDIPLQDVVVEPRNPNDASSRSSQSSGEDYHTVSSGGSSGADYRSITDEHTVIYRGKSANITDWPFIVAVGPYRWPGHWLAPLPRDARNSQPISICTGVIIAQTWVLTAGHCVKHFTSRYYVTGGTDCRPEFGGIHDRHAKSVRVSRVERFFIRGLTLSFKRLLPKWETFGNKITDRKFSKTDVALLKLDEPIYEGPGNDYIGPIRLESDQRLGLPDPYHIKLKTAGWGATRYSNFPERLKEYTLPTSLSVLIRPEQDKHHFDRLGPYWARDCLNASPLLCVKTAPDESQASVGDSGGPLISIRLDQNGERSLIGVVSGGSPLWDLPNDPERETPSGDTPEEDEPELVTMPVPKPGVRGKIGGDEVVLYVRVKDKLGWIQRVMDGIPLWKRLWNGICLLVKCLWYCLAVWWLDFLERIFWVIVYIIRYIRGV